MNFKGSEETKNIRSAERLTERTLCMSNETVRKSVHKEDDDK